MLYYPFHESYPIAFSLGPFKVHWYGIMYLIAFALAYFLGKRRALQSRGQWSRQMVSDLVFYCMLGVILGGRIGYMLFYDFSNFLANPLIILRLWEGGMAFHGGLLGVIIAMFIFGRRFNKTFFEVSDFTAPLVPLGIAAGRLGNFINGELWGKPTSAVWGMVFPHVDNIPRHPSQIYEFFLEGILLFIIVWTFSKKPRPTMAVSGVFSLAYGIFRVIAEFFRTPDAQYGYLAFNWLTMGQVLSIPMIIGGALLISLAYCRKKEVTYV